MIRRFLVSVVLLGVAVVVVQSVPDLARYLKMRQM
jgi:hypothetical protein